MGCQVSGAMYLYHSVPFQCSAVLYCIMGHYKVVRTALPVAIHKTITKVLDEILGQFWLYKLHGIEQNRNGSKFTFTAHVFHAGFVCNSYLTTGRILIYRHQEDRFSSDSLTNSTKLSFEQLQPGSLQLLTGII